jgi:hypothetical protein
MVDTPVITSFIKSVLLTLIILVVFLVIIQAFAWGPASQFWLNRFSRGYYMIKWSEGGLHLWKLEVSIRNFHLVFPGKERKTDQIDLKIPHIKAKISLQKLFKGKILIYDVYLDSPRLDYINIIASNDKLYLIPNRGHLLINKLRINDGVIRIEDRVLVPTYKILLSEIYLDGGNLDIGSPIEVLFRSTYGRCKLGNGNLLIDKKPDGTGFLNLVGVTWSELAGLKIIPVPILSNKIDLKVDFKIDDAKDVIQFSGTLQNLNKNSNNPEVSKEKVDDEAKKLLNSFHFDEKLNDLALPFDLALRKIIIDLFISLRIKGLVNYTFHMVTKGLINIFSGKKQE